MRVKIEKLLDTIKHADPMDSDFDPLKATPEEVASHGLPPRPNPAENLDEAAKWEQIVTELKGSKLVVPKFEVHQPASTRTMGRPEATKWNGYNWAGAVIQESAFDYCRAEWRVPRPDPGRGDNKVWYSSAYVGLDGWLSDDVLAGGTGHDVFNLSGRITRDTYGWFEWYPAYPVKLLDFYVNSGDLVQCTVWAISNNEGHFLIWNKTTGRYCAFKFMAPAGYTLRGDSAEWIVEGDQPEANFHRVVFEDCWASKRDQQWRNLSAAGTVVSTCEDGTVCTAEIKTATTLVVTYHGE